MPSLPDIPGKGLVTGTGRRAGKVAVGAGLATIAVGGYVARRLLRRGGGDEGAADTDPIAATPTAPPGAEGNGVPQASPPEAEPPAPEPRDEAPEPEPIEPADAPDAPEPTGEKPHPSEGREAGDRAAPPQRDKLDD